MQRTPGGGPRGHANARADLLQGETHQMGQSDYWLRKAQTGRVTRRRFVGGITAAGAGAASLSLVGCGDDDDDDAAEPTSAPGGTTTPASPTTAPAVVDGGVYTGVWLGGTQFDSVDPHRGQRDEVGWLSSYVLNKIVRFSNPDTGDLEGDLAEKWETADSQTFTFAVRKDVKWQNTPITNGRQLTAQDLKWHIERQAAGKLLDGSAPSFRFKSDWTGVKVETPDDYTLKLTLPAPNGSFLTRLSAFFANVPNREATEKFEGAHGTLTEEAMPGTNAFTLKQWRTGKDIILQKNPGHFRKDQPHIDGMVNPWGLFEDPNAYRLAFEQKQVDAWSSPDPSVTKSVIDANKDNMTESLTGVANTVLLHLNVHKQFKDPRLVKAMNMAVDRRQLIQAFHQGLGQVSGPVTWLQEGFAVKPEDLIKRPGFRTDRAIEMKEARELWAAGGGPALGDIDIRIPDTWLGPYPDTNQVVKKMFNDALGVSQFTSTKCTYNEDIIPNLAKGEYPNWMAWTNSVNSPDPRIDLYTSFHSKGSQNWSRVNNPELDTLLENARVTSDLAKARELVLKAQDILLENGMYGAINLYNYISRSAFWNYVNANVKVQASAGKPAAGYNLFAGHLAAKNLSFNPKSPAYTDSVKNRKI